MPSMNDFWDKYGGSTGNNVKVPNTKVSSTNDHGLENFWEKYGDDGAVPESSIYVPEVKKPKTTTRVAKKTVNEPSMGKSMSELTQAERKQIVADAAKTLPKTAVRATTAADNDAVSIMPREKSYSPYVTQLLADTAPIALEPDRLPVVDKNYDLSEQIGKGWQIGLAQSKKIQGGVERFKGNEEEGKESIREAALAMDKAKPEKLKSYDTELASRASWLEKLTNPQYLTGNILPSLPSSLSSMAAPLAIQGAGALGAGAVEYLSGGLLTPVATGIQGSATVAAGVVGRKKESEMEAGDAYNTSFELLVRDGHSSDEAEKYAKQVAQIVYDQNMKLTGLDIAEQALTFMVPGGKGLVKIPMGAAKLVGDSYMEGIEELAQQVIQNNASNKKGTEIISEVGGKVLNPETQTPEEVESRTAGAIMGTLLGGAGVVTDSVKSIAKKSEPVQSNASTQGIENVDSTSLPISGDMSPSIAHITNPIEDVKTEIGAEISASLGIPTVDNTIEETPIPSVADTITPAQDLVSGYIDNGLDKLQAWDQLGLDRGGEHGIHPQEFSGLYDALMEAKESVPEQDQGVQQQVPNVEEEAEQPSLGPVVPEQAEMPQESSVLDQPEAVLDTPATATAPAAIPVEAVEPVIDTQASETDIPETQTPDLGVGTKVTWKNHNGTTVAGEVLFSSDGQARVQFDIPTFEKEGYNSRNPVIMINTNELTPLVNRSELPTSMVSSRESMINDITGAKNEKSTPKGNISTSAVQGIVEQSYKTELPEGSYEISSIDEETNPELAVVKKWTELMKRKLTIVRPTNDKADKFNGFVSRDGTHIVLNEKSDNPLHVVVAHELVHDIKRNNPKLYEKLEDAVLTGLGNKKGGIKQWFMDKKGGTEERWNEILDEHESADPYIEEFIADCMQEAASAKTFYKSLVQKSIGAAKEFLKQIDSIISKLKAMPIDKNYSVKPYIDHWQTVRDACQDILVEYTQLKLNTPEVQKPQVEKTVEQKKVPTPEVKKAETKVQKSKPITEKKEEKPIPAPEAEKPEIIRTKKELSDQELYDAWNDAMDNKEVHLAKILKDEIDIRAGKAKEAKPTAKKKKVSDEEIDKAETWGKNQVTHEEERELGRAAQAGDKVALEKLVSTYDRMISSIANKYLMNKHDLTLEDLMQEGRIALIKVITTPGKKTGKLKYDPDYIDENGNNPRLVSIAYPNVSQAIKRYINEYGSMVNSSEHRKVDYSIYLRAARDVANNEGRTGTLEEVVEQMKEINPNRFSNLTIEKLEQIIKSQRELTSLNKVIGEDETSELMDYLANEVEVDPYHKLHMDRLTELLGGAMDDLSDVEKNIIYLRYFYDESPTIRNNGVVSHEKVAKMMNISSTRVGQLEKRAMEKLKNSEQLKGMSVDFSVKYIIDTVNEYNDVKFSTKQTKRGFIQSESNLLSEDDSFDRELLSLVGDDDRIMVSKDTFEGWKEFAKVELDKGLDKAIDRFYKGEFSPGQKGALGIALKNELIKKGREAYESGDYTGSTRFMVAAKDIMVETSIHFSDTAKDLASARLAQKFDATTSISYIERQRSKQYDNLSNNVKKEINRLVEKANVELNKINEETIPQVIDEVSDMINEVETQEVDQKVPTEVVDNTLSKIENHLNDPKNDKGPIAWAVKRMNELFKGWFSTKSGKSSPSKVYTMDIISRYLNNDPLVKDNWEEIRKVLRYEYGEDFPSAIDFFNYYLTKPTTDAAMNKSVHEAMRMLGINLNNLVTKQDVNEASLRIMEVMGGQNYRPAIYARVKYLAEQNKQEATDRLAKRIVGMAKTSTEGPKTPEENKIRDMMNMISKIARENLPKNKPIPKDPMDMIKQALSNYRDYQRMWMGAEREIIESYPEMKAEIALLQQFFNRPINDVVANSQLERLIRKGMSDSNIRIDDIIKKHYTEQTAAIQSLADKLVQQAGLKEEDADKLADMIQRRFEELVQDKKERMLNSLLGESSNKKVRKARETLVERICKYSNLGAFSKEQYREIICDRLGIPALTPEMCSTISMLCDKIQTSEFKMEPSIDGNHQVRWTTTYKYQLMSKDKNGSFQEVGRYNTLDEAKEHSPEGTEWRGWAETIGSDVKNELIMELRALLSFYKKSNGLKKLSTIQTIDMLLALPTAARNMGGNELNYWSKRITRLVSVPIDVGASRLTGKDRTICFSPNNDWISYWTGLRFGCRAAFRGWTPRGVDGQYELGFGTTFKDVWNIQSRVIEKIHNKGIKEIPTIFTDEMLQRIGSIKTPVDVVKFTGGFFEQSLFFMETAMRISLLGMDQASFTRAYENELGRIAKLYCVNNKEDVTTGNLEKYMKTMDDNLIEQCNEFAKKMTYQNDTKLTKAASKVKWGLNLTLDFGLGDVLMKFTKVPINLSQLALEFSPFGVLKGLFLASKPFLPGKIGGEFDRRAVIEAFSDALVGTLGFTGFGIWMGMLGVLTGKDDDDPRKKKWTKSHGGGAYKFNISAFGRYFSSLFDANACEWKNNDWIIGYSWAEPISTSMAMGVAVGKSLKEHKEQQAVGSKERPWKFGTAAVTAAEEGAGVILDRSVFDGIMSLFESPPGEKFGGTRFIKNFFGAIYTEGPATFIPSVVRECRVYEDPYMRVTWSDDPTEKMKMKIMDKIPGLSDKLPIQTDYLGNPIERNVGMTNDIFSSFVSPMYVNKIKLPEVESQKVINEVYNETDNPKALPATMNSNMKIRGENVKLTDDEMRKLMKLRGEEVDKIMSGTDIFDSKDISADQKVKVLGVIYKNAGARARGLILPEVKKNHNIE